MYISAIVLRILRKYIANNIPLGSKHIEIKYNVTCRPQSICLYTFLQCVASNLNTNIFYLNMLLKIFAFNKKVIKFY